MSGMTGHFLPVRPRYVFIVIPAISLSLLRFAGLSVQRRSSSAVKRVATFRGLGSGENRRGILFLIHFFEELCKQDSESWRARIDASRIVGE
jgi:hypothetical protein